MIFQRWLAVFLMLNLLNVNAVEANTNGDQPMRVYDTLKDTASLLSSPQFVVVDDFNSGKFKSQRGAPWRTKVPAEGALDIELVKEDARNPKRGYSLKANFNLLAGEKAYLHSFLHYLDVSQAMYLVFKYKINMKRNGKFSGNIRVMLEDWKHDTVAYPLGAYGMGDHGEWRALIIPISKFKGLDLDQLNSIKFFIESPKNKIQGELYLDEIAFFGLNEVAFESNRDNLVGYPKTAFADTRRQELLGMADSEQLLREIAKDTWQFFLNARDENTSLIVDHIAAGQTPLAADYTSPTNIAMDILASIAAWDLGIIGKTEAEKRVLKVFATLDDMSRYNHFFYNFYNTKTLTITRKYISSVDSGWLAIAFVIARQAFGGKVAEKATEYMDSFSFEEFLDPENNQFVVGYDVPVRHFGQYHYGMLISEARATSLYAVGKGDVPRNHWWFLFRTPPHSWRWQNQTPQGEWESYEGIGVFQGYYQKGEQVFVPSWGGSLFEYLMPTLVIDEKKYAPKSFSENNRIAAEMHRDYALKEKGYPVWGISPSGIITGREWRYMEYGIPDIAVKGYRDGAVVTPHVSFLALDVIPEDAVKNIRELLKFKTYGEYGFYDSFHVKTKTASPLYLSLDQGMILVAIANYLTEGAIRNRFHQDEVGQNIETLLSQERFFASQDCVISGGVKICRN